MRVISQENAQAQVPVPSMSLASVSTLVSREGVHYKSNCEAVRKRSWGSARVVRSRIAHFDRQ